MKYRAKEYDPMANIWILQKRVFLFWIGVSAGPREEVKAKALELNSGSNKKETK
jgi:hypothetical protein